MLQIIGVSFGTLVLRTGEQMGVHGAGVPLETFIIAWKWGTYLGHEGVTNGVDVRVSTIGLSPFTMMVSDVVPTLRMRLRPAS